MKTIQKGNTINSTLESRAEDIRSKTQLKEKELRLQCIPQLPDHDAKTALFMEFINSGTVNGSVKNISIGESTDEDHRQLEDSHISIADLLNGSSGE